MDRKSTKNLRLDRRLAGRKGWISPADLEKELSALPDVSDKIAEPQEKPESSGESGSVPQSDSLTPNESDLPDPSSAGV